MRGEQVTKESLPRKRPFLLCVGLYRASLFRERDVWFPPLHFGEDEATAIWLAYYADAIIFIAHEFYGYRRHTESATATAFRDWNEDYLDMGIWFRGAAAERAPELAPYAELLCSSQGHDMLISVIRAGDKAMLRAMGNLAPPCA